MEKKNPGEVVPQSLDVDAPQTEHTVAEGINPRRSPARATGPRTEAGKRRSSQNSRGKGIFVDAGLIEGESSVQFHSLRRRFKNDESLEELERSLREIAATIFWRHARLLRADGAEISKAMQVAEACESLAANFDHWNLSKGEPLRDREKPLAESPKTLRKNQPFLLPPTEVLDRHMRYERFLLRQLAHIVTLTEQLRRMRSKGHAAPHRAPRRLPNGSGRPARGRK